MPYVPVGIRDLLATFIPGLLIGALGENNADAYLVNGVVFAVMFMVCVFISWKVTWERELTPEMLAEMEKSASRPRRPRSLSPLATCLRSMPLP